MGDAFNLFVSKLPIERFSRERGDKFSRGEPGVARRRFTMLKQPATDPMPRKIGVNKKCANPCGVSPGIEPRRLPALQIIRAEQRLAPTPTTATGERTLCFRDEERAVANQL